MYPGSACAHLGQRTSRMRKERSRASYQRDETELPEFYADVETNQRQWQFLPWQPGAGQRAGKTKTVQQSKSKGYRPGMPEGEAGFPSP